MGGAGVLRGEPMSEEIKSRLAALERIIGYKSEEVQLLHTKVELLEAENAELRVVLGLSEPMPVLTRVDPI